MGDKALITLEEVSRSFGHLLAVDRISFSVRQGDVLGFLGPNGAGKSTTMRMITGYLPPTSGNIWVEGHNMKEAALAAKHYIGYLPEGGPLYPDMTPNNFLAFIGAMRGLSGKRLKDRFDYVVSALHLEKVLHQPIETLSKGFRRRVALAQAVLHDPRILILDEPTDGLDPNQKREVRALITSMAKDKAIIISTHILEEAASICNRAIVISGGRIIEEGTPESLAAQSSLYHAVVIRGEVTVDMVKKGLEKSQNIKDVQPHADKGVLVLPEGDQPILLEIAEAVRKQRWKITALHTLPDSLEDAFRQMTGRIQRQKEEA